MKKGTSGSKTELCAVCGEKIRINHLTYAPPCTDHPVHDEGMYCEKLEGYVCKECFDLAPWTEEEKQELLQDWGIEIA